MPCFLKILIPYSRLKVAKCPFHVVRYMQIPYSRFSKHIRHDYQDCSARVVSNIFKKSMFKILRIKQLILKNGSAYFLNYFEQFCGPKVTNNWFQEWWTRRKIWKPILRSVWATLFLELKQKWTHTPRPHIRIFRDFLWRIPDMFGDARYQHRLSCFPCFPPSLPWHTIRFGSNRIRTHVQQKTDLIWKRRENLGKCRFGGLGVGGVHFYYKFKEKSGPEAL